MLLQEEGAEKVEQHLDSAAISAVNLSEVVAKGVDRGLMLEGVIGGLSRLPLEVIPFDAEQAYVAASLRPATRKLGLSLGDRACLALGLKQGLPVLTADQLWAKADVGVKIELIR